MQLNESTMRERVQKEAVGFLATVHEGLQPHLVPVVFAAERDTIWIAIDQKPKDSYNVKRVRNVLANPNVSFLVQHYEADWQRLWWVRLDGTARIVDEEHERRPVVERLQEKYPQHRVQPPPGPVIEITVTVWKGWAASGAA